MDAVLPGGRQRATIQDSAAIPADSLAAAGRRGASQLAGAAAPSARATSAALAVRPTFVIRNRLLAACAGTFASRGTFIGGNAVAVAAKRTRDKLLEIAGKEMEMDPADLDVVDGEGSRAGRPSARSSATPTSRPSRSWPSSTAT